MSETPEVKLPVTCARTGKTKEIKLPLTEVESFLAKQRNRETGVARVQTFFSDLQNDTDVEAPHLVAFYKGKLVVLDTVLNKSDAAVLRMLHDATQSDVFPKPAPRKRKKAEAKQEKEAQAPKKSKASGKSTSDSAAAPAS